MANMKNMHDDFWNELLPDIREAPGLQDLSIEESKKAYDEAPMVKLNASEIERLTKRAMTDSTRQQIGTTTMANNIHDLNVVILDTLRMLSEHQLEDRAVAVTRAVKQQARITYVRQNYANSGWSQIPVVKRLDALSRLLEESTEILD